MEMPSSNPPASAAIPEPTGWEDAVSGVGGPDFWRRVLIAEIARSTRYGRPLTVALVELVGVDHLAKAWGTELARHTIRETAQCLRRASRSSDYVVRLERARFGIILPEIDEVAAINFVERVRSDMPGSLPHAARQLRFGFGWASPKPNEPAELLVRRLNARLVADLSG